MDSQILVARKGELLDRQEHLLLKARESGRPFTRAEEQQFDNWTKELDSLSNAIGRHAVDADGNPTSQRRRYYALGASKQTKRLALTDAEFQAFWRSLKNSASLQAWQIKNATSGALSEGGDGALIPVATDATIPAMGISECAARQLSRVITTDRNINLPYQSAVASAAIKVESTTVAGTPFATNVPQFATTLAQAWTYSDSITCSIEFLEDVKGSSEWLTEELNRIVTVAEESDFIGGAGTESAQGYIGNGTTATGASITAGAAALGIAPLLDTIASLNKNYYANASLLIQRSEFIRLLKILVTTSDWLKFFKFDDGKWTAFGFPVAFSYAMPAYVASPATNGVLLFGDFRRYATITNRFDSNVRLKVVDSAANVLNGQTTLIGWRRCDQRVQIPAAVVQTNLNG